MNVVDSVLMYGKPYEWEDATYAGKLYHLFDLQPGDEEYLAEVQAFHDCVPKLTVKSLQRYQNPSLLGRFKVRKEQILFRSEMIQEIKYYHPIPKQDLTIALEYNMDVRRYTHKTSGNSCNSMKDPKFYRNPGDAYNAIGETEKVIIVCKLLGSNYETTSTSKKNDAEYVPTYVAEME